MVLGVLLLAAMIVGIAATCYFNIRKMGQDGALSNRSRDVADAVGAVENATRRLQAAQRAYLIAGLESWLAPYLAAKEELAASLERLDVLTAGDDEQKKLSAAAAAAIGPGIRSLDEVVAIRRTQGFNAVQEMARKRGQRSFVDPLLDVVGQMRDVERVRLEKRERESAAAYWRAILYSVVGAVLGLLSLGMFDWLLGRSIRARSRFTATISQQREVLDATLRSIGDGVIATDGLGNVSFLNGVAEKLTGWTNADAAGLPLDQVFRIVREDTREPVENPALRALSVGVIVGLANHTILVARDGAERPIDDSAAPIRDGEGRVAGAVLVFRDITERRRVEAKLRELEQRQEFVKRSSGVGFWYCDLPFDVLEWDELVKAHFHLPADAVVTIQDFYDRIHPDDREPTRRAIEKSITERTGYDVFYRTLHPTTKAEKWIRAIGRTEYGPDGSPKRFDGVTLDVTAQKKVEEERERFHREVDAERALLNETFLRSPSFVTILRGPNHVVERANDHYLDLVGRRRIVGKPLREALPEVESQGFVALLDRVYATGEPYSGSDVKVVLQNRSDGEPEERCLDFVYQPLRNLFGDVNGVLVHGIDLTARRRAEDALRDENRVVETLNAIGARLAAELDLDRLLQMSTDEATKLTGAEFGAFFYNAATDAGEAYMLYTLSGAPREAFSKFPHPRATQVFEPTFRGVGAVRLEDVTKDPRFGKNEPYFGMPKGHLPVRGYLAVPVKSRSGEVLGGLFLGHSSPGVFTERHERLAVGVAAMAGVSIDNARLDERLCDQDKRKDEFLALLAHELRNPLAPLRNGLEVLRTAGPGFDVASSREMMERQLSHMVRMIDDLLDISRVNQNKMELRRATIPLSEAVDSAVETVRSAVDEAGLELAVELPEAPVLLHADVTRLQQVFGNLLSNSAKFTEAGGRIRLSAKVEGDEVVVLVQDDGVGIPPEFIPNLFDMFSQVDRSIDRRTGGLGIGLALVRGLVEMHGGTVTAASGGTGLGSTFTVRLPIVREALAPTVEAPTADLGAGDRRPAAAGSRVLVVDDNRDSANSMAIVLKLMGYEVHTAFDGVEAVAAAEAFRPQAILMDIGMPQLNGYEATRRIREQLWGREMVVVALTGWGQEVDRARSRDSGCDGHLVKPVDLGELEKLLGRLMVERADPSI